MSKAETHLHPQESLKGLPEGFDPAAALLRIEGREFKDEAVVMDYHHFVGCTFTGCQVIYHGAGIVGIDGCKFHDCSLIFEGFSSNTLAFLSACYSGIPGTRSMIEGVLEQIRTGGFFP